MKRIAGITILLLLASIAVLSQSKQAPQSYVAGRFVAFNYGQWSIAPYSMPSGTGAKTFVLTTATVRLPDGRFVMPFNTNAPIFVGTEQVTPSAVTNCVLNGAANTCSITATFSSSHKVSDYVSSATYGLQEALNDAGNFGGAVTVDGSWAAAGGTTGIINAATLPSNTGIEDVRTGAGGSGSGTVSSGSGYKVPIYASAAGTTIGPSNIYSDATGNNLNVPGMICVGASCPTTGVSIGALGTPTNWNFDTTTAQTALTSLTGAGQALANGTTATTQSAGDSSTKVATDAFVLANTVSGNFINIFSASGSTVTASGCTISGGVCTVTGSPSSSITISSIPTTGYNLHLNFLGNTNQTSIAVIDAQFNGDTSTHYNWTNSYWGVSQNWGINSSIAQGSVPICNLGATT